MILAIVFAAGVLTSPFIFRGIFWARAQFARLRRDMAMNSAEGTLGYVLARPQDARGLRRLTRQRIDELDNAYRALKRALGHWDEIQWPWTSSSKLR